MEFPTGKTHRSSKGLWWIRINVTDLAHYVIGWQGRQWIISLKPLEGWQSIFYFGSQRLRLGGFGGGHWPLSRAFGLRNRLNMLLRSIYPHIDIGCELSGFGLRTWKNSLISDSLRVNLPSMEAQASSILERFQASGTRSREERHRG